jgi:hypothetical protein
LGQQAAVLEQVRSSAFKPVVQFVGQIGAHDACKTAFPALSTTCQKVMGWA